MLNLPGFKTVLLLASAALWLAPPTPLRADDRMTAGEFLARCDRFDADCRTEFVAGLQAVYEGKLACPPRIDVNTPITPWLDYMHRRVLENPSLADADNNRLQLEAFQYLWPCPEN